MPKFFAGLCDDELVNHKNFYLNLLIVQGVYAFFVESTPENLMRIDLFNLTSLIGCFTCGRASGKWLPVMTPVQKSTQLGL